MSSSLYVNRRGVLKKSSKFKNWINKPFPFIQSPKNKLKLVFCFSIFTYLLLQFFHPFGITISNSLFLMGFELSVFSGLYINYFLIPFIFKSWFNPRKWVIKYEILFIIWNLIVIAVFDHMYNSIFTIDFTPHHNLLEFIGITIAVCIVPLVLLVFGIEYFLRERNKILAWQLNEVNELNANDDLDSDIVTLKSEKVESDVLVVQLHDFLFASSLNNLSTIFFYHEGVLYKKLMHLSIKEVEEQLSQFPQLIKCHKSYIVNKSKIKKITGDARSVNIHIDGYDEIIPMSWGFPEIKLKAM